MNRRLSVLCVIAAASVAAAAPANATEASVVKQVSGIYCDNGVTPELVFTVKPNGTARFTLGDAMVGTADGVVIVDLGHDNTTQLFVVTKAGTTEYRFDGEPQSVLHLPFVKNAEVSVC